MNLPCPKCGAPIESILHERTVFGYCNTIQKCEVCGTLIINGEVEETASPYSKLVALSEIAKMALTSTWNKIPYRGQSIIIILMWLFIPSVLIDQTVSEIQARGITTAASISLLILSGFFSFLGCCYIVMEVKGELRKRKP